MNYSFPFLLQTFIHLGVFVLSNSSVTIPLRKVSANLNAFTTQAHLFLGSTVSGKFVATHFSNFYKQREQ